MSQFIYRSGDFKVMKGPKDYIVINIKGTYRNHGHFQKLSTCFVIIRLVQNQEIPQSKYMIEAARRLTTDSEYRDILTLHQRLNNGVRGE